MNPRAARYFVKCRFVHQQARKELIHCYTLPTGLLFLSGGRATLGRSNKAIAALLCSLFPVYPMDTMDCRYHLQAFRHLYVLAVEYRCLELHDADTHEAIVAPVHITISHPAQFSDTGRSSIIECSSPCLLPPHELIERLEVVSPRYWPLKLDKALLKLADACGVPKVCFLSFYVGPNLYLAICSTSCR